MSNTIDETKLTAYALDELPAGDRSAVEAYLADHADHADARAAVAEIRQTAAMLSGELARELAESLPARSTMAINPRRRIALRWKIAAAGIAAAAALAVGMYELMPAQPQNMRPAEYAENIRRRTLEAASDDSGQQKVLDEIQQASHLPRPQLSTAQTPPKEIPGMFGVAGGTNGAVASAAEHSQDGQNVLHGAGSTEFTNNPFAGTQRDNIYTARAAANNGGTPFSSDNSVARNSTALDTADSILLPGTAESKSKNLMPESTLKPDLNSKLDVAQSERTEFRDANGNILASQPADIYFHRIAGGGTIITDAGNDPNGVASGPLGGGGGGGGAVGGLASAHKFADASEMGRGVNMASGAATNINSPDATGLSYFHGNVAGALSNRYQVNENGHQFFPSPAETGPNTESYPRFADNAFLPALQNPLSTFSIDVDTASYANIRRFLNNNQLPPGDAVRIEEMVNYFPYDYAGPRPGDDSPVAVHVEVADCPWEPSHRLARVALKAKTVAPHERPASNLVFLIDVSGSMGDPNKLDLLKKALPMLVEHLTSDDHVSIVTYAGETGIALPRTNGANKAAILSAIDNLNANGSTNGGAGILLAYSTATSGFIKGGVNRVILATDGDFNVGVTDPDELVKMIEQQAKTGVYLSVLGMGMGNVKDATMEKLADHGHGNYAYIDSLEEANKVLSRQVDSTLITVAKDVKVQVEFNPVKVAGYRLVGYEDRAVAKEDFNNDQKTAGDMGAGHAVTALYEIVPNGVVMPAGVDPLKYQPAVNAPATNPGGNELMTVKIRYKQPENETSQKLEVPVEDTGESYAKASSDFRFASAVASLGMMLRNSPYKGNATYDAIIEDAGAAKGEDAGGYRTEFVELVMKAKSIADP